MAEGDGLGKLVGRQGVGLCAGGLSWDSSGGRRGLGLRGLAGATARSEAGEQQGEAKQWQRSAH